MSDFVGKNIMHLQIFTKYKISKQLFKNKKSQLDNWDLKFKREEIDYSVSETLLLGKSSVNLKLTFQVLDLY